MNYNEIYTEDCIQIRCYGQAPYLVNFEFLCRLLNYIHITPLITLLLQSFCKLLHYFLISPLTG